MASLAVSLAALAPACLSHTAAPDFPPLEGTAVPVRVSPTYEGRHKVWKFRVALTNNLDQDLRITDYDIEIFGTDTGYHRRWTVVPSRETLVKSFASYSYATDYSTISRLRQGKERRVYRTVGMRDGAAYSVEFVVDLLR